MFFCKKPMEKDLMKKTCKNYLLNLSDSPDSKQFVWQEKRIGPIPEVRFYLPEGPIIKNVCFRNNNHETVILAKKNLNW